MQTVKIDDFSLNYDIPDADTLVPLLDAIGKYSVRAVHYDMGTKFTGIICNNWGELIETPLETVGMPIWTDPVEFEIIPIESDINKEAYSEIKKMPQQNLLYNANSYSSGKNAKHVSQYKEFAIKYTGTFWGEQAAMVVALAGLVGDIKETPQEIQSILVDASNDETSPIHESATNILKAIRERAEQKE